MSSVEEVTLAVRAAAAGPQDGLLDRLCSACRRVLGVEGVGVCVMAVSSRPLADGATDKRISRLEDLQFTLGEGPALSAFAEGAPMSDGDLLATRSRWPLFAHQAAALIQTQDWPIRALHAFPIRLRRVPLGVLDVYVRDPGELPLSLEAPTLTAARSVASVLIEASESYRSGRDADWQGGTSADQALVDQAIGMVMAQMDTDAETALARLRAHAFAEGRSLGMIAEAVVARRLRFARETP